MPSALLNKKTAQKAIDIVSPGILALMEAGQLKRNICYVVVLNPARTASAFGGGKQRGEVIWEGSIGKIPRNEWERSFDEYAHAKADVAYRTGLDTHILQLEYPHLYSAGDFKYGGAVNRKGFVVSTSGLEWYEDHLVSGLVAAACHSLSIAAMVDELKAPEFFIREPDNGQGKLKL